MYSKTMYTSPIGDLTLVADEKSLVLLEFSDGKELKKKLSSLEKSGTLDDTNTSVILEQTKQELDEYFQGKRKVFTVQYKFLSGTEFQQKAWNALATIPY
jgi:methylated-DNA-[protein]-cysteine S-methyltransferase